MPRLTIRLSDHQLAAVKQHGGGDASLGVRRLIADKLGVGEADPPPPNFTDAKAAKKASRKGLKIRWES